MIGLGSYSFFWRSSDRVPDPLSLRGALTATAELGVTLFQICDDPRLDALSDAEAAETAAVARDLGLTVQLGTKGLRPDHLRRYLRLAEILDARLVRSMLTGPDGTASADQAQAWLTEALPAYAAAGVTLALETYEQIATADLVTLVRRAREQVPGADVGVCLDPANVVARLEDPRECVETAAADVVNVHVKDFAFARQEGWVGFTYSGAPMGTGLHDYDHLLRTVRPRDRGIDEIVEHWLPWQGDAGATVRAEADWTAATLDHLHRPTS